MGLAQIPLLQALTSKMHWHQARQSVLAENVANAETPGYKGRDLKAYSFDDHLRDASMAEITTAATNPGHFSISSAEGTGGFSPVDAGDFEVTPEGNAVTLEDEMMKVASNQMDYQAVTTLYTRSLRLIRTALGRAA
jgi:flagellar basal-body rod protein FlgB